MYNFHDMPYERPDMAALAQAYEQAIDALNRAASYPDARAAFFGLQQAREHADTMMSLASVRNTVDTTDPYYDGENATLRTTDDRLIEDTIREGELQQKYQKDSALATADFRGEQCNFYGLLKHMESTDREERREAAHVWAGLYERISPQLVQAYDELVRLRTGMARKMGFSSYTEMAYLKRRRFDYTQEDTARFRRQIRDIVTPAVAEIRERQRRLLGVDTLRWYDEALIFPEGNADPIGTQEELVRKAQRMYREMSPETGEFFDFMVRYGLFDLETRPGKRMGGYMTRFPAWKAPFIFSSFNGTSADVDVLTHEAGHAFQGYLAMRSIPVSMLTGSTSEINEIHSMTMEHFAYPWMELFFGDRSEAYRTAHLIGALSVLPYMAVVDEFQHRVYAEPDMDAMARRRVWRELERVYMPWRDYDGEPFLEEGGFWMQKQHIFLYPFYYIDYALAQMCAFQYYGLMKTDRARAWADYLRLCRAGGTQGYFELLKTGSLLNPFEDGAVRQSVGHVIDEILQRYAAPSAD